MNYRRVTCTCRHFSALNLPAPSFIWNSLSSKDLWNKPDQILRVLRRNETFGLRIRADNKTEVNLHIRAHQRNPRFSLCDWLLSEAVLGNSHISILVLLTSSWTNEICNPQKRRLRQQICSATEPFETLGRIDRLS